jgi:preprotein translocase subunit SecG
MSNQLNEPPAQVEATISIFKAQAQKSETMIYLFIVVHVLVCLFLIAVILLQQGKSADLAGAFGGQGSQTAFGPRSAANLLTKTTTWAAVIFMITSIGLTILMQKHSAHQHSVLEGTPTQSTPAKK